MKPFDYQAHADALLDVESNICAVLLLCEGLEGANGVLTEAQYKSVAAGAFPLIALAMSKALKAISEIEPSFRLSHGLKYKKAE